MHTYKHTYRHRYIHTYVHTSIRKYVRTYREQSVRDLQRSQPCSEKRLLLLAPQVRRSNTFSPFRADKEVKMRDA